MAQNIFGFVKDNILISEFVRKTGTAKGMHETGPGEYRTNNILSGGKNPNSMHIRDNDQFFKMYSNGQESGDVIELYRLLFNKTDESVGESALGLAEYMGVSVPEKFLHKKYTSTSQLYPVMNKVAEETCNYLLYSTNEDASLAREYLNKRSISEEIVKKWSLGLFPSENHNVLKMVKKCGKVNDLAKVGIIKDANKPFVSMRGRLSFPIFNQKGDVVAFSSRSVDNVDHYSDAKYINTPTTVLFDKSKNLYGQHLLSRDVKNIVICEGNLDVIALNEAYQDDKHTIALATCGTSLTDEHANMIKNHGIQNVCLLFDSDKAGRVASVRSVFLDNYFKNSSISSPSNGKDPWDGFIHGEDITKDIDFRSSIILDAVQSAKELYDEQDDFIRWVRDSYSKLNLTSSRKNLLEYSESIAGIRKNALDNIISGVQSSKRQHHSDSEFNFSKSVELVIRTLMSYEQSYRDFLATTLLFYKDNSKRQTMLEILGSSDDEEDESILSTLSSYEDDLPEYIQHKISSLTPSHEECDNIRRVFIQTTAMRILHNWNEYGIPAMGMSYVQPLVRLRSGYVPPDIHEAMLLIFDSVALSVMRK